MQRYNLKPKESNFFRHLVSHLAFFRLKKSIFKPFIPYHLSTIFR